VNQAEEDLSSRVALDLRQGGVPRGSVAMCALWAFFGDRDSDQSIEILDRMGFEDAPLPCGEMCGQPSLTTQHLCGRLFAWANLTRSCTPPWGGTFMANRR
jgi:hypothetical protein